MTIRLSLMVGIALFSSVMGSATHAAPELVPEAKCIRLDLDAPWGSLWGIETGAQGRNGTCYAWAGAHMADAYRQSQCGKISQEERISVIASSIARKDAIGDEDLNGGGACPVVNHIAENGFCTEKSLPSMGRNGISLNQLMRSVITLRDQVIERQISKTQGSESAAVKLTAYGLTAPKAQELQEAFSKRTETEFLSKVIYEPNCTQLEHFPFPECRRRKRDSFESKESMKQFIDAKTASTSSAPIVINYCSRVLAGKDSSAECGPHASLISGRRWFPSEQLSSSGERLGRCTYKIHNSWGRDCTKYSRRWACEGGNVWVDQAELLDETLGFMFLE